MTADLSADLDRIEGLAAAATGGDWGNQADFALIAAGRTDLPKLAAVVRAVLRLHARRPHRVGDFVHFGQTEFPDLCGHCRTTWPCATVRAATKAWEDGR